jgi:hypothetical protein
MGRLPLAAALLLCALFLAEAVLRPRADSPDAYQYLDVAVNLAEGHGLVQSVPGYNSPRFPLDPVWPQPFTSQPPFYPWAASLAIRLGVAPESALAMLAAAGTALAGLAGAGLAAALWGETAGALALAGLLIGAASPAFTARIWSDTLAIGFTMLTLLALLRASRADSAAWRWAVLAGAGAGYAFLTRYVFGLLIPFGAAWLWFARPGPGRLRAVLTHAGIGVALAVPVLARNQRLVGGWFGEPRSASTQSLAGIASHALQMTWGRLPTGVRIPIALAALTLVILSLATAERRTRVRETVLAGAGLVPLWAIVYSLAMVAVRLRIHFDDVGVRLLSPALAAGMLIVAGLAARLVPAPRAALNVAITLALFVACGVVGSRIRATPAPPPGAPGVHSEFMTWLARETAPGGVLVAEDAVDLAWALRDEPGPARRIASFSPAPYMRPPTQAELERFAARWCMPGGPPLRFVVRAYAEDDAAWRTRYGNPIADAIARRPPRGVGLVFEREIGGKRVLRWSTADSVVVPR